MQTAITVFTLALMARIHALRQQKSNAATGPASATSSPTPTATTVTLRVHQMKSEKPAHHNVAAKVVPGNMAASMTVAQLIHGSISSNNTTPLPQASWAFLAASVAMGRHKEAAWNAEAPPAVNSQSQLYYLPLPSSFGCQVECLQRLRDRCLELKIAWVAAPFGCLLLIALIAASRGGMKEDTEEAVPTTTWYTRRPRANKQHGAMRAAAPTSAAIRVVRWKLPTRPPIWHAFAAAPGPEETAYY